MHMEEELLRKILEKLESIDEHLENISNKLNKPLIAVSPEIPVKRSLEKTQSVISTPKKE